METHPGWRPSYLKRLRWGHQLCVQKSENWKKNNRIYFGKNNEKPWRSLCWRTLPRENTHGDFLKVLKLLRKSPKRSVTVSNMQWGAARSSYLWQRAVELMDGVHHVQQHVVTDHQLGLWSRRTCHHQEIRPFQTGSNRDSQIWRWRGRPWKNPRRRSAPPVGSRLKSSNQSSPPRKRVPSPQTDLLLLHFLLLPSFSLVVVHFADLDVTLLLWEQNNFYMEAPRNWRTKWAKQGT